MSEYKIGEFRANIRQAFDEAARGESVCIDRYGEDFYLVAKKDWPSPFGVDLKLVRPLQPEINKLWDGVLPQNLNVPVRTMEQVRELTKKNIDVSHSEQKD